MAVISPLGARWTVAALLILTAVTGLVDAVSYLRLGHVFVANMTGNVVFLGVGVVSRSGLSVAASLVAIAGFVLGAFAGGRLAHSLADTRPAGWLVAASTGDSAVGSPSWPRATIPPQTPAPGCGHDPCLRELFRA